VAEVYLISSSVRHLQTQLRGQKGRLAKLNIVYAARHPEMVGLQSQIDTTKKMLTDQFNGRADTESTGTGNVTPNNAAPHEIAFTSGDLDTNVSFVNRATPPVKPSKPKILTGVMLGVIAAGALGLGIPLGYELFNRRVRCRDDLERHHGIPVLVEFGALPPHAGMLAMRATT